MYFQIKYIQKYTFLIGATGFLLSQPCEDLEKTEEYKRILEEFPQLACKNIKIGNMKNAKNLAFFSKKWIFF